MRVAFIINCFCVRGTEGNIWVYAHYNEVTLKNESIIICRRDQFNGPDVMESVRKHFTDRFTVLELYDSEIDPAMIDNKIDVCMFACAGTLNDFYPKNVPTISSCVFDTRHKIGTVHSAVSEYLTRMNPSCYLLPNIINISECNDDLRNTLNIPIDAIVFGRYGGYGQFDIPYVHEVVKYVAQTMPNIYFIFMNTNPFVQGIPNIIYLEPTPDLIQKKKFINTCNAMLHARTDGETYGMACGEFAVAGKPIITTYTGPCAHIEILKEKAITYANPSSLYDILTNFKKYSVDMIDNGYIKYKPEFIMPTFKMLLDKALVEFTQ